MNIIDFPRGEFYELPEGWKPMQIKAGPKKQPLIHAEIGSVAIQAAEKDGDEHKPARFSVDAYTGGALEVAGYDLPIAIDLAGLTFAKHVVANLDHDRTKRVGHVTATTIEGSTLKLSGVASAATPYRDEVVNSARDGFEWEASVEAYPTVLTEVRDGEEIEVNGQTLKGPLYVASKSKLTGFAFLSHGADPNTVTSIAATGEPKKEKVMDPKFRQFVIDAGFDPDNLTATQDTFLKASFDGQPKPPSQTKANGVMEEMIAEQKRRNDINGYAQKLTDPNRFDRTEHQIKQIFALAAEAIEQKESFTEFRLKMTEIDLGTATVAPPGSREQRVQPEHLAAAICIQAGLPRIEKHFPAQVLESADKEFRSGIGLNELILHAAKSHGYKETSMRVNSEMLRAAWGKDGYRPVHGSGFSTTSLPNLLSNIANKFLLNGWEGGDMTWSRIASITPVNDFKTRTSFRLNGFLTYAEVGKSGDIPHGQVGEEVYTNRAQTYGAMLAITREDFINDDLGALTGVPRELGFGAIDKLNDVFWTIFLNNGSFFDSGNNNVSTGVLGLDAVTAAEGVLLKQTKPNGEPLALRAETLLVPPELKRKAMSIVGSSLIVTGENTTLGNANVWQGELRVESAPYLSNTTYSGSSPVAFYLLANPSRIAVIDVAFLNGRQTPIIETADAEFHTLGIRFRGYHDFGVALQEPRGGVRSTGAT